MTNLQLGMPYMGGKRKLSKPIIDYIIAHNPKAKYFYDLFGGGGAVSFEALQRSQFKEVNYNELNTGIVELLKKIRNEGVTEEFYQWVSRETFNKHKNDNDWFGGLLKTCWSFGNNQKDYLFGKDIEQYKKNFHLAVVNNIDTMKDMQDYCKNYVKEKYGIEEDLTLTMPKCIDYQERRLDLRMQISNYQKKCNLNQLKQLELLQQLIHIQQLKRFQPFERIEQLKSCQQIERLNHLKSLQQPQQLERLEKIQQLQALENLIITNHSYQDVIINTPIDETVIYCDPPYKNTAEYKEKLGHNIFNEWVKNSPYKIYVSSYESDLNCALEMDHRSTLSQTKNNKVIEKLFCNKVEVIDNERFKLI
jgi:site-specific DNA-adenine methylase